MRTIPAAKRRWQICLLFLPTGLLLPLKSMSWEKAMTSSAAVSAPEKAEVELPSSPPPTLSTVLVLLLFWAKPKRFVAILKQIGYTIHRSRTYSAFLTGVEIDSRPHIMRRSCSPVIPRLCSSLMVTLPTLCNSIVSGWERKITVQQLREKYTIYTFQLETAPFRCLARVLLLLLITITPRCSVLGSSPGPNLMLYSCRYR